MASRMVGCLFVLVALLQGATAQTKHIVGDNMGWAVPNDDASFYSTWAASKTFRVGDTLVFNFATGNHDVETVRKAGFDACSASNRLSPVLTTGPATITLNKEGEHYYLCSIGAHCTAGQKLAINVTGATSSSPPTTTFTPPMASTLPPPTPGGPPSNSAPASIVAGFSATFLIAAAAVLF